MAQSATQQNSPPLWGRAEWGSVCRSALPTGVRRSLLLLHVAYLLRAIAAVTAVALPFGLAYLASEARDLD